MNITISKATGSCLQSCRKDVASNFLPWVLILFGANFNLTILGHTRDTAITNKARFVKLIHDVKRVCSETSSRHLKSIFPFTEKNYPQPNLLGRCIPLHTLYSPLQKVFVYSRQPDISGMHFGFWRRWTSLSSSGSDLFQHIQQYFFFHDKHNEC